MAVDILPTALPREASQHFSDVLQPYLRAVLARYRAPGGHAAAAEQGMEKALERATIASGGVLREEHKWLEGPLGVWRTGVASAEEEKARAPVPGRRKRVLMLGSGMVAGPAVDEIARHGDVELLVGESISAL